MLMIKVELMSFIIHSSGVFEFQLENLNYTFFCHIICKNIACFLFLIRRFCKSSQRTKDSDAFAKHFH